MRERVWLPGAVLSPRSKAALAGRDLSEDHEDDVVREEAGVSLLGVEHWSCLADEEEESGVLRCWRREKVFRESRVVEGLEPRLGLWLHGVEEAASSVDGVRLNTLFLRPTAGVVNATLLPAGLPPPARLFFVKLISRVFSRSLMRPAARLLALFDSSTTSMEAYFGGDERTENIMRLLRFEDYWRAPPHTVCCVRLPRTHVTAL